jgi:hypothetical protein
MQLILSETNSVADQQNTTLKTVEYQAWQAMKSGCTNVKHKSYKYYGALGISICEQWISSFKTFYTDMGPRPSSDYGLSRRDNKGNFEPNNCYWATRAERGNNRRNNKIYEVHGKKLTQAQLTKEYNICQRTLQRRLLSGDFSKTVEECISPTYSKTLYTHNGQTKNIKQWAEHFGIRVSKLHYRLRIAGWSFEKSIST